MQDTVRQTVTETVGTLFPDAEAAFEVTYPEAGFGDFSTNAALQLAKPLGKNPREIAEQIAQELTKNELVENADVAGPGFINITLKDTVWREELGRIGADYLKNTSGDGQKVQVEFISANPTGPTTIGNARGGFIGDVVARVLEHSDYKVTREYYFNDGGTQITKLLGSVKAAAGLIEAEDRQYGGEYIDELAREFKTELETKDDDELKKTLTTTIVDRYIKPAIAKMNIEFDEWTNERDLIERGVLDEVLAKLKEKDLIFDKDGATWLKLPDDAGSRTERVLIKSSGDPTYLAPDLAYHYDIFGNRGFDIAVKELGSDHIDQFPAVKSVVDLLFPDKQLLLIQHQWFRLLKDGKEVKISKRAGNVVTIEELIDEVGADIARFMTLSVANTTHVDFDLDLAKEQSNKNPYWYVMYAYARAHSLLAKAEQAGTKPAETMSELLPTERQLVLRMSQLPGLVTELSESFAVHKLTHYGHELARLWHEHYEQVRILENDQAAECLFVVNQFQIFMRNYFALLGITPVERI